MQGVMVTAVWVLVLMEVVIVMMLLIMVVGRLKAVIMLVRRKMTVTIKGDSADEEFVTSHTHA